MNIELFVFITTCKQAFKNVQGLPYVHALQHLSTRHTHHHNIVVVVVIIISLSARIQVKRQRKVNIMSRTYKASSIYSSPGLVPSANAIKYN